MRLTLHLDEVHFNGVRHGIGFMPDHNPLALG